MNQEKKEKIIKGLLEKKVNQPCSRCQSLNFEVVGQTFILLNEDPKVFAVGGPAIPSAVIACSQCGFITLHALGPLGLMPKKQAEDKNE
jgi:hypothetical protein